MEGLLGAQQTEDLRKRSIGTGLANALVGYLAMPKNQNLGLGRILAGSAQAGLQGAQGVYDTATADYMQAQKIAEMQRAKDKQTRLDTMLAGITDPNERLYAQIAPQEYVANKTKALKPTAKILQPNEIEQLRTSGYNIPVGAVVQVDENGKLSLAEGTFQKEGAGTQLDKLVAAKAKLVAINPNDPNIKLYDSAIAKETQFAPTASTNVKIENFVPAAQQLQKESATSLQKNYDSLQFVPQTIATMQQAKQLVPSAVNFTGSLGEQKLQLSKFFNNNFGTNIDPTGIQSAEQLRSALFTNVMDNLKKMDASPSQQQQQVMSKAFGTLDTDPKALPKIIDIYENILRDKVKIHNSRVDQISKKIELPYDLKVNIPEAVPQNETLQQRIDRVKRERQGGK
jgi:hypothetical protein